SGECSDGLVDAEEAVCEKARARQPNSRSRQEDQGLRGFALGPLCEAAGRAVGRPFELPFHCWAGKGPGPSSRATPLEPFPSQLLGRRHFRLRRALLFRAGRLQGCREALEARLGEEGGKALRAHLALAEVGVTVTAGAERGGGVVDVQAAQTLEADLGV